MMDAARLRIVDGHAHVASSYFIPREFAAGACANILAQAAIARGPRLTLQQATRLYEAQNADHSADELVREMDAAGVARTVLLVPDFSHALQCRISIEEMAARHHEIRKRHPGRFYVFQGIDPRGGAAAQRFFRRTIVEYGFNGLKLYPPCGYSPSDERLDPFYEICREYQLPVLLHTGPTSPVLEFGPAHPALIDRAAHAFPEVNFILAHGGVNNVHEAALLCAYRPNVFLDIAGFPGALDADGWQAPLRRLFRLKINHKIIFGTDWPLFRLTHSTRSCIEQLLAPEGPLAGLPAAEIEAVMAGNIERLIPAEPAGALAPQPASEAISCN